MKYTFTFTARLGANTELIYVTSVDSRNPEGDTFSLTEAGTKAARRLVRDIGDKYQWELGHFDTEAS